MQGNILELNEVIDNIGLEPGEEIKAIDGYPGYYITNYGRVLSTREHNGTKWKWLKLILAKRGYLCFSVRVNNKVKHIPIHREVAKAFVDGWSEERNIVNHINEVKTDNRACNLEWTTIQYNNCYGTRIQKVVEKLSKPVGQYTLDGELVKEWCSIAEAGRNGYDQGSISSCCRDTLKTHKKFKWRYLEDGTGVEKLN